MAQDKKPSRYLEYLPAIYHQDREGEEGSFVGQFLLPFEEVLAGFEQILSSIDDRISPALAPEAFVPWLASWVALALDDNWDPIKQRRLIGEAVRLYRHRGLLAGLQEALRIYDPQITPLVHEGRWPGGMQIGVASQIGGLTPEDVPLTRIERMQRRDPPVGHDYYVIDTVATAGHPHAAEGEPLRLYHRADRVKSVHVGYEPDGRYVRLELLNGESRLYEPATVSRRDGLIDECYTIALTTNAEASNEDSGAPQAEPVYYRGSSILVPDLEQPYRFILEIQVPCQDWAFLFRFRLASIAPDLPADLWREFEMQGIALSDAAQVTVEGQGHRWWRIDDGDPEAGGQTYIAVRQGIDLDVYRWAGCKAWEEAMHPRNVQAIRAIVDDVKPAHTAYYLKFTPLVSESALPSMQIGVQATIDVDARIG